MEAIGMRCTREQLASMKKELSDAGLKIKDHKFDCNYLVNNFEGVQNAIAVFEKMTQTEKRKVYETFDKAIFLKACGIDPNKIIFDQVKEYFKDAVDCVSVVESEFNMKDYDLNSLYIDYESVFIKNNNGEEDKLIYDLNTKEYVTIVTAKTKLTVSFNPSKNWLEDAKWAGGTSITSEQLRELTEPKNEPKRLKVGGIYKWNDEGTKILMKVTKVELNEIFGYGFIDGYFNKEIEKWYTKGYYDEAVRELQETTQEKWEKALLKYKK